MCNALEHARVCLLAICSSSFSDVFFFLMGRLLFYWLEGVLYIFWIGALDQTYYPTLPLCG